MALINFSNLQGDALEKVGHSRRLGTRGEFVIFYQDLNLTASLAKEEKNEILKVLTKFC